MWNITKAFEEGLQGVLLTIDSVIYWAFSKLYGLFVDLASARIFEQDVINAFANRIYNLIGVVMLFVIAYSILTAIVDPSKFTKGDTSFGKIVMNVITSLILLAIIPTLFDYAYSIQTMLITNNVMGSLLLGQDTTDATQMEIVLDTSGVTQEQLNEYVESNEIEINEKGEYVYYQDLSYQQVKSYGNITAFSVLNAFLNPDNIEVISSSSEYVNPGFKSTVNFLGYVTCGGTVIAGAVIAIAGSVGTSGAGAGVAIPAGLKVAAVGCGALAATSITTGTVQNITEVDLSWSEAASYVKNTGDFNILASFAPQVSSGEISYTPIISTICGLLLLYIILSFCLDLGVRAVKLVFYQLIAPIPILLRIVPKESKIFNNWTKAVLATYFEVFVRLAIIYMITYLASNISAISLASLGAVGKAIIIMGLVAFAKEAPKLISEVTGISSGNMKLGIRDKLAAGGALMAGAAIGAGVTAFGRNAVNAWKKTEGGRGKKIANALKSGFAGGGSAFVRGGYAARSAKSFADVKSSASKGAAGATEKALTRASYKKNHNGSYRAAYKKSTKGTKFGRALDAMQAGVIGGHLYDAGEKFVEHFDSSRYDSFNIELEFYKALIEQKGKADSAAQDLFEKYKTEKDLIPELDAAAITNLYKNHADLIAFHKEFVESGKYSLDVLEKNLATLQNRTNFKLGETVKYYNKELNDGEGGWVDGYIDASGKVFEEMFVHPETGEYYFNGDLGIDASMLHSSYMSRYQKFLDSLTKETKVGIQDAAIKGSGAVYDVIKSNAGDLTTILQNVAKLYVEGADKEALKAAQSSISATDGAGHILKAYEEAIGDRQNQINLERFEVERRREAKKKNDK